MTILIDGATSGTVWVIAAAVAIYLGLVGLRVAQARANRRRLRSDGDRTRRAGELAVLGIFLGAPVTVAGGLLMLGTHRSPLGAVVLAAGLVIMMASGAGYRVANL